MPELTTNIPLLQAYVSGAWLSNYTDPDRKNEECLFHAVSSLPGRSLGFHGLLRNGAGIGRVPPCAVLFEPEAAEEEYDAGQLWDNPSVNITCTVLELFKDTKITFFVGPDKKKRTGTYEFTLDWHGTGTIAEAASDMGWKSGHALRGDDGYLYILPNNRICWNSPAWTAGVRFVDTGISPNIEQHDYIYTSEIEGSPR
jgi:hypothetical protein